MSSMEDCPCRGQQILTHCNCFFHKNTLKNKATTSLPQLITLEKETKMTDILRRMLPLQNQKHKISVCQDGICLCNLNSVPFVRLDTKILASLKSEGYLPWSSEMPVFHPQSSPTCLQISDADFFMRFFPLLFTELSELRSFFPSIYVACGPVPYLLHVYKAYIAYRI